MNTPHTSLVRFDAAMNLARNILAKEISVAGPKIIPAKKLSLVSEFIEKNTFDFKSPIIHFLSAYDGEGVDKIASGLAILLSETYGKKVLLVDACGGQAKGIIADLRKEADISINDLCTQNMSDGTPFLNVERSTLFYAPLVDTQGNDPTHIDVTALKKFLMTARANFDFVIIASERSVANAYPFSLSSMAQLNILVVSAKKTRKQVVAHMMKSLSEMDAKISATILSNRTYFIPQFLYKWLFAAG